MTFKFAQEVGWVLVIAAAIALGSALVTFDPAQVTDWQAWGWGIAGQVVRAVATAFVAALRPAQVP